MLITTHNVEKVMREQTWQILRNFNSISVKDFKTNNSKNNFANILNDGAWRGERCFIIAGGKSLSNFDFSKLNGEKVIAINCAFMKVEPSIAIFSDSKFYRWLHEGVYGADILEKFKKLKCPKVFLNVNDYAFGNDVFLLDCDGEKAFNFSLKEGLGHGNNTGYAALNLAAALGASPIYLLGYDMKGENGKQVWWHNYYPDNQGEQVFSRMKSNFNHLPQILQEHGIEVFNLNPESGLEVFQKIRFEDIGKNNVPLIVSFATEKSIYEHLVTRLIASLNKLQLNYKIYIKEHLDSWHANTCQKAGVILEALKEFPDRDILFIDADAIVWDRDSILSLANYDCDIAARIWKDEILSGTIYIKNNAKSIKVISEWAKISFDNRNNTNGNLEQRYLRDIILAERGLKFHSLDKRYCWIDAYGMNDTNYHPVRPQNIVIEHFQTSRLTRWQRFNNYAFK